MKRQIGELTSIVKDLTEKTSNSKKGNNQDVLNSETLTSSHNFGTFQLTQAAKLSVMEVRNHRSRRLQTLGVLTIKMNHDTGTFMKSLVPSISRMVSAKDMLSTILKTPQSLTFTLMVFIKSHASFYFHLLWLKLLELFTCFCRLTS